MQNNNNMLTAFNQFRQTIKGDPQKQVEELLRSGRMSNAQFQELQKKASDFQRLFGIK